MRGIMYADSNHMNAQAPNTNDIQPQGSESHLTSGKRGFIVLVFWLLVSYPILFGLLSPVLFFSIGYRPFTLGGLFVEISKGIIGFPIAFVSAFLAFGHPENIAAGLLMYSLPAAIFIIIIATFLFFFPLLRRFIVIAVPLGGLLLAIASYVYFSVLGPYPCDYWSCEKIAVLALIFSYYGMAFIALVPFAYALKSGAVRVTQVFQKSLLPGLISIFLFSGIWFVGAYYPAQITSEATDLAVTMRREAELKEVKSEVGFLEPVHIPKRFCGKSHEQSDGVKIETFYGCPPDKIGGLEIIRLNLSRASSYLYAKNLVELREDIVKASSSGTTYNSRTRISQWKYSAYEDIIVNGNPALFVYTSPEWSELISDYTKEVIFFTETVRIEVIVGRFEKQASLDTTKEELIQIAESISQ